MLLFFFYLLSDWLRLAHGLVIVSLSLRDWSTLAVKRPVENPSLCSVRLASASIWFFIERGVEGKIGLSDCFTSQV